MRPWAEQLNKVNCADFYGLKLRDWSRGESLLAGKICTVYSLPHTPLFLLKYQVLIWRQSGDELSGTEVW